MRSRQLGKHGPEVPVICFGAWPIGGGMGEVDVDQAIATVHAAIDAGSNFIDTAEGYRTSEGILGRALAGRRNEVFLATKLSGDHSAEHIRQAMDNSLKSLGTDYVDLYQIHSPKPEWPIEDTMHELMKLRAEGKVRYVGVSNFSAEQTAAAAAHGPLQSSQPRYNMVQRTEEDALEYCLEHGIGVIAHSPLAKGFLTGKYSADHLFPENDERRNHPVYLMEMRTRAVTAAGRLRGWAADHGHSLADLAIAWTLAHPAVTSSIVGAKTPEQARENAAASNWELSRDDTAEIDRLLEGII